MKQTSLHTLLAMLATALLSGCATPPPPPPQAVKSLSYVALLASPDGSVGKVLVRGAKGCQPLHISCVNII